jgi:hypothetical protein
MIAESIISLVPITYSSVSTALRHHQQRSAGPKVFTSTSPRNSNLTDDDYYEPTNEDEDPEHEPAERLVPMFWIRVGLVVSAVLCIVLVWMVFGVDGIHPWATAVGLVLASVLSLIGVRALGETDINPVCPLTYIGGADQQVSGIGKISQLIFAILQPGNVVANIIAGGVAEAGAQQ